MKSGPLLFCSVFLFTSCATITRGVHEKLKVQSDPAGANVTLSTGEKGITPATFVEKRRRDQFTVTVSKPGYVSQTVTVQSKAGGTGGTAMAGNILLGGAIGMGVDAGTGAYDSLYPNPVSVTLEPVGGKSKVSRTKSRSKSLPPNAVTPLSKPTPAPQR
ncbi:MAG TPA: PEGA domain-containing protein [Chthoniobacterales bacterium]|nr:PEGA domain-containing protein [Chthoniobacterales bacterium]